jgi:hypothetical protein
MKRFSGRVRHGAIALVMVIASVAFGGPAPAVTRPTIAVVVQSGDAATTAAAVRTVRRTLDIVGGVAADTRPGRMNDRRRWKEPTANWWPDHQPNR